MKRRTFLIAAGGTLAAGSVGGRPARDAQGQRRPLGIDHADRGPAQRAARDCEDAQGEEEERRESSLAKSSRSGTGLPQPENQPQCLCLV